VKLTSRHLLILGAILLLSICFGVAFDAVATAIDKKNHPMPNSLSASVERYADEFGVPETVLWATVKEQSDFSSNLAGEDGAIGLMQISPELYELICREILAEDPLDAGILYDPETNLRIGAAYLSYLYQRYGVWDAVFAAYHARLEPTSLWETIPEEILSQSETQSYVKRMNKSVRIYSELYYE